MIWHHRKRVMLALIAGIAITLLFIGCDGSSGPQLPGPDNGSPGSDPECEASGRVVDSDGNPVANATVRGIAYPDNVTGPSQPNFDVTVETDENGEFCVEFDNATVTILSVTRDGHETVISDTGDDRQNIEIVLDDLEGPAPSGCPTVTTAVPDVDQQAATATISGVITGSDARAIGAALNGTGFSVEVPGVSLVGERNFEFAVDLMEGSNALDIFVASSSCGTGVVHERIEIPFTPGQPSPDCPIQGRVVDEEGNPLAGVEFVFRDLLGPQFTGPDGTFCFGEELRFGTEVEAIVRKAGYESTAVTLTAGDPPLEIVLRREPTPPPPPGDCEIEGVVRDVQGDPLPGATVERADGDEEAVADGGGQFCLDDLPEGQHLLVVSLEGFGTQMVVVRVGADEEPLEIVLGEAPVELPTQCPEVTLDAPQINQQNHTAEISGTATNVGGPWIGWIHNGLAFAEQFPIQEPLSAPQPFSFSIDLLDGPNQVTVFASNPSCIGSNTTEQLTFDPGPLGLSGLLTDGFGFPVAGRVNLFGGGGVRTAVTGTHGQYRFEPLPDDRYGFAAVGANWTSRYSTLDLTGGTPATRDVQLTEPIDNTGMPCPTIDILDSETTGGQATITLDITNSDGRDLLVFQNNVPLVYTIEGAPAPGATRSATINVNVDDGRQLVFTFPTFACSSVGSISETFTIPN